MKLFFTYHAQSKALERHIHESIVADIIRNPDSIEPAKAGAFLYRKKFQNDILEVVCVRKHKNTYLVLTMYFW